LADYDIKQLLAYSGPSLEEPAPMADGVMLVDYLNTEENARKIATLLSATGIPFHLDRLRQGWKGRVRLIVTVPRSMVQQAEDLLTAAANVSEIDLVLDKRF
jgi:hypothetical protein